MWKRLAATRIKDLMRDFPCVCLLGSRQVGKTTLVRQLFPKARYYDLESPSLQDRIQLDPEGFLRHDSAPIILDEFQTLPLLSQALKVVVDENRHKQGRRSQNGKFILLGSASPLLLKGVSESLAGRVAFVDLDPLTFEEIDNGKPKLTLHELWLRGGYPQAASAHNHRQRRAWFESYTRTFIERDLPFYGVELQPALMNRLLRMLAHTHGQLWNASQLAASTGVSYHTINRYLGILEKSFIIRILQPYHFNISKRLTRSPKIYFRDSGLLHYFLGISNYQSLLDSPYCGASWEGFVIEQLIRHDHFHENNHEFYFYRTQTGLEADLVIGSGPSLTAAFKRA